MTEDEAYNLIAEILNDWFQHVGWTPGLVAEVPERIENGDIFDPSIHYADFGLLLLERAGVLGAERA